MKTPEPNFNLREPKSVAETAIQMVVRFNNQRIVLNTGEKVNPKYWDLSKQRVRVSKSILEGSDINSVLDNYSLAVKKVFRETKIDGNDINLAKIKAELEEILNIKPKEKQLTFLEFYNRFIEESKSIKKDGTIRAYNTTLHHIEEFIKETKFDVDFNTIDLIFYKKYTDYLRFKAELSNNTIGKHIKIIKTVLNAATDLKINTNYEFKTKGFKKLTEDVKKIYLTEDEIQRIYDLNLYYNKTWEEVRDLFVVACYTGLRFSDLKALSKEHIKEKNGKEYFEVITNKTDQPVIIPISKLIKEILIKYNYKLPKVLSNQKFNEYLKIIGELAKINEIIIFNRTEAGIRKTHQVKKYDLISAHTARRSMATNMYLNGIPAHKIMLITGHKSERVFQKYISITQEENALDLVEHDFFN